jgi:TRAP-type C4-dicarboxylate transport system permease small subunit
MQRLLGAWHRAECAIAAGAFGLMALLLVADVAGREFLHPLLKALGVDAGPMGLYGAQKIAVFALVLATYAGIGIATASAAHLVPQVAFRAVPARWSATMNRLADALSGVLLLAAAAYSVEFVIGSYTTGLRAPMLQWFVWPVQLAMPAGFASAAVRYLCFARWPALRPQRAEAAR